MFSSCLKSSRHDHSKGVVAVYANNNLGNDVSSVNTAKKQI